MEALLGPSPDKGKGPKGKSWERVKRVALGARANGAYYMEDDSWN